VLSKNQPRYCVLVAATLLQPETMTGHHKNNHQSHSRIPSSLLRLPTRTSDSHQDDHLSSLWSLLPPLSSSGNVRSTSKFSTIEIIDAALRIVESCDDGSVVEMQLPSRRSNSNGSSLAGQSSLGPKQ
jgi:hypothetical protein